MMTTRGGNPELTSLDVISAIPDTVSGHLLQSLAQDKIPSLELREQITAKCINCYNIKITRKRRFYKAQKGLDDRILGVLVNLALESLRLNITLSIRRLAELTKTNNNTAQIKYLPVYEDFYCLINSGMIRASRQTKNRLKKRLM